MTAEPTAGELAVADLEATAYPGRWLAPGTKTVTGYLLASRGPRKRDYGLLGNLVVDVLEDGGATVPRYQDLHSVWIGYDPDGPERNRHRAPFLRYKSHRPIDGLRRECNHHRVEITCMVGRAWDNGLGAYITRASGHCLDCVPHG